MIIDVIGIPGAGKTTLLKALLKQKSFKCGLRFRRATNSIPRLPSLMAVLERMISMEQWRSSALSSYLLFRPLRHNEQMAALASATSRWGDFVDLCLRGSSPDCRPAELRLMAMQWFLETLQLRAWAEHGAGLDTLVFMDEPLSFRLSFIDRSPDDLEFARRYFECMPLPAAIIYLQADIEIVMSRLTRRRDSTGTWNQRHQDMLRPELRVDLRRAERLAELSRAALERRGVRTLVLDASRPAKVHAPDVLCFTVEAHRRYIEKKAGR